MDEPAAASDRADADTRSRITFRRDRVRGLCTGIIESGLMTFGLVVAIRYFELPQALKATVASANAFGLLLTPATLYWFGREGSPAARAAARNFLIGAVFLAAAALAPNAWVFVPTLVASAMVLAQQAPLMVHIYTANYRASHRGRLLSNSIVLSLITAILFTTVGGHFLDRDLGAFRWLFAIMAVAAAVSAVAVAGIPSQPITASGGRNPLAALRFVREDRTFAWMLGVWMLMGFGNLMMFPLRVEYLANPAYGINATNTQIAIATAVLPSVVRLATTHVWGIIFDRYNFFRVRAALNSVFVLAMLTFFFTDNIWIIYLGGAFFGLAMAGGNIAWNLWVTKFAPPGRAADYMSVHTFFTGVRGVLAPFVGFLCIGYLSASTTSWIAASLVVTSIILIEPLRRHHERLHRSA